MKHRWIMGAAISAVIIFGQSCTEETNLPLASPPSSVSSIPTNSAPGEWILYGRTKGEQRYSTLDQINVDTVDRLGLAFMYDDIVVRGQADRGMQATPLMDAGILYFTSAWDVVYAVDARTGEEIWVYDPEVEGSRARVACCDVVNRGVALQDDQVFVATTDGYLIALDKKSGKEMWKSDTFVDRNASYTITGAPRLAGDVVVIGNGGAELGVRGYVSAYDIETGAIVWRFFTVPSAGPDETEDITRARETWSASTKWEYGAGGTAWDSMVYDEDLNTVFVGTGNGSPWPSWERGNDLSHDNLYLSSIVALDAETGLRKWHYQTSPGDSWDYTATQNMILADLDWNGETRKVIMQAPKNGFFYVLDRGTGELLSAEPYVPVSWAGKIDLKTGRPILTPQADYSEEPKIVTPSPGGGHNWPPMAFSLKTGLVYIPTFELSTKLERKNDGLGYINRTRNDGARNGVQIPGVHEAPVGLPKLKMESRVIAWDPVSAREIWRSDRFPPWTGGLLTTAGNLVIGGTGEGFLRFYDAGSGKLVKSINTGTAILAAPITYSVEGEQYIAVVAGAGGLFGRAYLPGYAPLKFQNASKLLVFKLDGGEVQLPAPYVQPVRNAIAEGLPTDEETLSRGKFKYERFCATCHSARNQPNAFPDLWNMSPSTHEAFDQIVLEGVMEYGGMASFSDVLSSEDTLAIRSYIANDRRKMKAGTGAIAAPTDFH